MTSTCTTVLGGRGISSGFLLFLLLCSTAAGFADDVQLPTHVLTNKQYGLVIGEDIMNGLVLAGLKAARLPFDQGPGGRIDTVIFTSVSTDPNTDYMCFTPVCVLPEKKWAFQRNCGGCTDPEIQVPMADYVALGGTAQQRPASTPWGWTSYPAVPAWVFVRTYPSRSTRGSTMAAKMQTIAGHRSGERTSIDLDQRFTFDLGTFVHEQIPGVHSTQIREKYGWYSTEFAVAYTSDFLSIIPVTKLGRAGSVVYGSLVSTNLMLSAFQYSKASTDADRLNALLNITSSLGYGYVALSQSKVIRRGVGQFFGKPAGGIERQMFEDLIGEDVINNAPKLVGWVTKASGSVQPFTPHGYKYLQDYLTAAIQAYPADVQAAIQKTYSWQRIFSFHRTRLVLSDLDGGTLGLFHFDGLAEIKDGMPFGATLAVAIHEIDGHGLAYSPNFASRYVWRTQAGMSRNDFINAHISTWLSWETEATIMGARSVDELTQILPAIAFLDGAGRDLVDKERLVINLLHDGNVTRTTQTLKQYLAQDIGYNALYADSLGQYYDAMVAGGIENLNGQTYIFTIPPFGAP